MDLNAAAKLFRDQFDVADPPKEVINTLNDYFITNVPMTVTWDQTIPEITPEKKRKIAEILYDEPEYNQIAKRISRHLWEKQHPLPTRGLPSELWDIILDYALDVFYPFWSSRQIIICKDWYVRCHKLVRKRIQDLQTDEQGRMKRVAFALAFSIENKGGFDAIDIKIDDWRSVHYEYNYNTDNTTYTFKGLDPPEDVLPSLGQKLAHSSSWRMKRGKYIPVGYGTCNGHSDSTSHTILFFSMLFSAKVEGYRFTRSKEEDGDIDKLLGMKPLETKVFTYEELSEAAKSSAFLVTLRLRFFNPLEPPKYRTLF